MKAEFNDRSFDPEHYDEFYENHHFQPLAHEDALAADEVIPRFGWATDVVEAFCWENEDRPTLLDLGCLDGSFALTVANRLGIRVTGIDLTKDGIEIAKARAEEHKLPAEFYQGRIENVMRQFIDEGKKFDVITWFEIIEHVDSPEECQALIEQLLNPGGIMLCSTPSFESPYFGMDDEQNKCHVRLFTTRTDDYEALNKFGHTRKATSMPKFLKNYKIREMEVVSELINVCYGVVKT